ncbi:bifunctional aspartate kinase/homoserine dehydrogenase I [Buchnera aphidicola]|uniref:bifunctional aspartate kinase/homoserine dehydrogenase I n=1 Tax=Buchnera aphidicola TaxID=9 RepID=UPI003463DA0F
MKILKFGGTSLSNSKMFLLVSNIIEKKIQYHDIAVVLSAPAKITNYLEKIIKNIKQKKQSKEIFDKIRKIFYILIYELNESQKNFPYTKLIEYIDEKIKKIKKLIKKIKKEDTKKEKIYAQIISTGEILSIKIMTNLFIARKYPIFILNPVKNIIANDNYFNATANIKESKIKIENLKIPKKHTIFMPGFIAGNKKQELVTLGRNGSDYSAAILSVCLNSKTCEIWTDVNGIYTADPKIHSKAKLLTSISYQEAIELSYFGAKVLHPNTILPLSKSNIICIIKNTFFPKNSGTKITPTTENNNQKIKGITHVNNISCITIKIYKKINFSKIIKKILNILNSKNIHILSIQKRVFKKHFIIYIHNIPNHDVSLLIKNKLCNELEEIIFKIVSIINQLKMISIISTNLNNDYDKQLKIFSIIKYTNLNILAIKNQLSQNSISIITNNVNINENINIIHNKLLYNTKIVEVFIIGVGGVGTALIKQLKKQIQPLKMQNIKIKICAISNSKKMLINLNGIELKNWKDQLNYYGEIFCIKKMIKYTKNICLFNPVIIDCTANQKISESYYTILKNNIHIITPNKKSNSNNWIEYQKIRQISIQKNKKFLYETNVSAGLPIIHTLKNLFNSGDKLIHFQGILSGSLSFIFGKLEEGLSIVEATIMAKKMGFTEPNPKDDLSGIDVARKLLILAREAGYKLELKDIKINPILPKKMIDIDNEDRFIEKLSELNEYFFQKVKHAKKQNKVLRFIGTITKKGCCHVKLEEIDQSNPLYNVKNGENALTIYSKYYNPIPLVLRGYGAGNDVTASGIFSDLLKILS